MANFAITTWLDEDDGSTRTRVFAADRMVMAADGTLLIAKDDTLLAAFASGTWTEAERVEQPRVN